MSLKKTIGQSCAWLGTLAAATVLVACGGSSSAPDPLQPYRTQALQWAPCDPTILGSSEEETREPWQALGDRLQCATMRAPMDWAQPDRSDVFISVMRVASAQPAQRRGSMLFNPGGPGGDGLSLALTLFSAFGQSNPDSTQGALQLRLLDSYDMVGFSPRGTGASTRLNCATNELMRFTDLSPLQLGDANAINVDYNDRKTAEACQKNPLTPYISTDAAARDMDLLRGLLGDAKLNYVGYSYGTLLGSWYASLFPDKVGRMVLDSAVDFNSTPQQVFVDMALARQRLHEQVLLPYAARHSDYFGMGTTSSADISARLLALSSPMQGILSGSLGDLTYSAGAADSYIDTLQAAWGLDQVLGRVADRADEEAVKAAVQQQVFVVGQHERDQTVRTRAQELYQDYRESYLQFEPESFNLNEENSTFWAVTCTNSPYRSSSAASWANTRSTAQAAPFFFGVTMGDACIYWPAPRAAKPALSAMQRLDVLLVQAQYDAATATEGADRLFAQLPQAKRVYVPGEYQHGVFPYTDSCVDSTVVNYLLGQAPRERQTACQANPLAQDLPAEPAPAAATSATRAAKPISPAAEPPTYLNPEEAKKLIDHFKAGIGRRP